MLPINISPTDRPQWHTPEEICAAAAEGLRIDYNAGRGHVIRCRKAANVSGWITAVTEAGRTRTASAGHGTPTPETTAAATACS
jgi:hypothetical protein